MAYSLPHSVSAASAGSPRRRVFRVQDIPPEWTKETLAQGLHPLFPGQPFWLNSLCKHPVTSTSTSLITFDGPAPESLSKLNAEEARDVQLTVGDREILFTLCLGLTTLFEPEKGEVTKIE